MSELADDDPRHGTRNGYGNLHCRCPDCRAAATAYMALRRLFARKHTCPNCGGPGGVRADHTCHTCSEYQRRTGRRRVIDPATGVTRRVARGGEAMCDWRWMWEPIGAKCSRPGTVWMDGFGGGRGIAFCEEHAAAQAKRPS